MTPMHPMHTDTNVSKKEARQKTDIVLYFHFSIYSEGFSKGLLKDFFRTSQPASFRSFFLCLFRSLPPSFSAGRLLLPKSSEGARARTTPLKETARIGDGRS